MQRPEKGTIFRKFFKGDKVKKTKYTLDVIDVQEDKEKMYIEMFRELTLKKLSFLLCSEQVGISWLGILVWLWLYGGSNDTLLAPSYRWVATSLPFARTCQGVGHKINMITQNVKNVFNDLFNILQSFFFNFWFITFLSTFEQRNFL